MSLRRRTLLVTASTLGVLAGFTGVIHFASDRHAFLRRVLHELVGPFRMSDRGFADFAASFDNYLGQRLGDRSGPKWIMVRALYRAGALDDMIRLRPGTGEKLHDFKRELLTHFVVTTNVSAQGAKYMPEIAFNGAEMGCQNPFARFEPEEAI